MTPAIEKYLNSEDIKKTIIENKYDAITAETFIEFINDDILKNETYGIDSNYKSNILTDANKYTELFLFEKNKGFSLAWSKKLALCIYEDDDIEHSIAYAFRASNEISTEQALIDLTLYSDLTEKDEFFIKHFLFLIKNDVVNATPSIEEKSISYSYNYKKQISEGKSELFADRYSDLIAENKYSTIGCYAEAAEFEKAILSGHSVEYANAFSYEIAEYIANHFRSYEESLNDVLANQERNRLTLLYNHIK